MQCVPDIFAFNNFYQLNGISNHIGGSRNLVFSNNCSVLVEKSEVFSVPCDPYHLVLDIQFAFDRDLPLLDNSHKYFIFQCARYSDGLFFSYVFQLV